MTDPIKHLTSAVYSALCVDLQPVIETVYRSEDGKRIEDGCRARRPCETEVDVIMFPQTWSSTALGFGGIGGQAFTAAYTVVVQGPSGEALVYFGGNLAYRIKRPNHMFGDDVRNRHLRPVGKQHLYEDKS
ncbi:hypothetical protein FHS82_000987 [Pseudochelatococcus lubricantis]|uniref:Uncharacterized protein n=1 Tax=Pseudochelatococcus lubricantis TaxID=1538102 RepID=A0ABX0UW28_9HYPH|nr:hypothetical protein [Pseudochelatococcus lubricantis]NIJ57161.1 hypothetical protein [Pseudochelatococcus lubricantis]